MFSYCPNVRTFVFAEKQEIGPEKIFFVLFLEYFMIF